MLEAYYHAPLLSNESVFGLARVGRLSNWSGPKIVKQKSILIIHLFVTGVGVSI